jgi:DNA helicase-2/ATP-dependent DNA helicase PcrA
VNEFESRYKKLNTAQREAVDTIDGPVMVVAGPGTGKTELLSMRVANILRKSDVLPGNILCLTFTESGAAAMRERLIGLIGPEGYKVAIHTFHSFGTEVINQNGEYFFQGAHFRPADELSSYEVLRELLEKLPHDNVLFSKMNGQFTYLRDLQTTISDLKKSGLTPDELLSILDRNDSFCEWIQPRLHAAFGDRLSKKSIAGLHNLLDEAETFSDEKLELIGYQPLNQLFVASLQDAVELAEADNSTKPLSAWKRTWCEKRDDGEIALRDTKNSSKIRAVAGVYYDYLVAMQQRELYDFDDMILRVVHAVEVFDDLRYNLQEQYQYILIDEFQDTNDAQMRLTWNLTNNPASEGRPNLLVVGDDDQAIYRFQGANLSNILDFESIYRDVTVISLRDNYRSSQKILELSRSVIIQGQERLETSVKNINKQLTPQASISESTVTLTTYDDETTEYTDLAKKIAADFTKNPQKTRAIIARHHRQLQALLPYLNAQKLPLHYERQENVLESPPVQALELIAQIVVSIAVGRADMANALMPQLLAHPAWGIPAIDIWQLSLESHRKQLGWLEIMQTHPGRQQDIAEWLIEAAQYAQHEPLEFMLDHLFGSDELQVADNPHQETANGENGNVEQAFISPLRAYFFGEGSLDANPAGYLAHLNSLRTIRRSLREYRPDRILKLIDFIEFVDMHRELGLNIQGHSTIGTEQRSIELLTAHKAKGLEYDDVYVISMGDDIWGETARSRGKLLNFPHNMPYGIAGDSTDERIRLLYVALTRAKQRLLMSSHGNTNSNRESLPVAYIMVPNLEQIKAPEPSVAEQLEAEIIDWRTPLLAIPDATRQEVLKPTLQYYKLSATHLNNFLDVTRGGPQLFLLQNLLRFPQAMGPSAAYGSAIHLTLQRAHQHLSATSKRRPIEDVLGDFEKELRRHQLSDDYTEHYLRRGVAALNAFMEARYDSFDPEQIVERSFGSDAVAIDNQAIITGAIDLIDIDHDTKTITVTDYKTGKATRSWQGKTDYEKIKLHHYRQQLIIYKLLIEGSREFAGYTVNRGVIEFVEPNMSGGIERIEMEFDDAEIERTKKLITAVWQHIQSLDFKPTDGYDANYRGIIAFEDDLIT